MSIYLSVYSWFSQCINIVHTLLMLNFDLMVQISHGNHKIKCKTTINVPTQLTISFDVSLWFIPNTDKLKSAFS